MDVHIVPYVQVRCAFVRENDGILPVNGLQNGSLRHYHNTGLCPAAPAGLLFAAPGGRSLDGEVPLVRLYHALKGIAVVAPTHGLSYFVDHRPYRLVTLQPQLTLDLFAGKPFFCGTHQAKCLVPGQEGKVRVFHYRTAAQGLSRIAGFTLIGPFILKPVMRGTPTSIADDTFFVTLLFKVQPATFFIRKMHRK